MSNKEGSPVAIKPRSDFAQRKCVPCEGGVPVVERSAAAENLQSMPNWTLSEDGKSISQKMNAKNFAGAVERLSRIASLAEEEQHHPDLHITGYRHLSIVLTTHAIGGLSENDFIVAAKIDELFR